MTTIMITIRTDNSAFEENCCAEVIRILKEITSSFEKQGLKNKSVRDLNGNTVGRVRVSL